jgi:hypothetical protein
LRAVYCGDRGKVGRLRCRQTKAAPDQGAAFEWLSARAIRQP